MDDVVTWFLASTFVSSVVASGVVWLARTWISEKLRNSISHEYNEKLESHKIKLQAQSDVEIEKLRSQLNLLALEHNIKFSSLHQRRIQAIEVTYPVIRTMYNKIAGYVSLFEPAGGPSKEDWAAEFRDSHADFRDVFMRNLIYFPSETARNIEKLEEDIRRTYNEFSIKVLRSEEYGKTETWMGIFKHVEGEMKTLMSEMEEEFRNLIEAKLSNTKG